MTNTFIEDDDSDYINGQVQYKGPVLTDDTMRSERSDVDDSKSDGAK